MELSSFALITYSVAVVILGRVQSEDCPSSCTCVASTITCENIATLPRIPPGIDTVILTNCHIQTLEDNYFKNVSSNVTSLTMRRLNMDKDVAIKSHSFDGLDHLQKLELTSTRLNAEIGIIEAFSPLVNLRYLNLSGNALGASDINRILKNMAQLETLDLSKNWIDGLDESLSKNFHHMVHVNLAENEFIDLDSAVNVFNFSTNLQYLDFSAALYLKQGIYKLGPVFKQFLNPITLNLSDNMINDINDEFFENGNIILELYLRSGDIQSVSKNAFRKLSPIKVLDFSNNKAVKLDDLFLCLKNMNISQLIIQETSTEMDITMELVTNLESTDMRRLDLSHGQISTIKALAFSPLTDLNELDLSLNKIHSIAKDSFQGLNKLRVLRLQHNKLSALDMSTFDDLYTIQSLSLNDNLLLDIDEYLLVNTGDLVELDLSNNNIAFLHDNFFYMATYMRILRLNRALKSTKHSNWRKLLKNMIHLETLLIQDNEITSIQVDSFQNLASLRYVDISGNKLEVLPVGLFDGPTSTIESINANSNLIKTIDYKLFYKLDNLTYLDLSVNRFDCTCNLADFASWMVNNSAIIINGTHTKCFTPESLKNTPVMIYANQTANCYIVHPAELAVGYVVVFVVFILVGIFAMALVFYIVRRYFKNASRSQNRYETVQGADDDI
ncbi:unnamed protein product [Owenia fusiformis]|uniref:LRRCT domain-containing protein n=1 Tax=Owenia fusiformis TaxID=6347 RepID=A0A8S4PVA0_OWEFU|nr:unnamed protein product [Owenia fusiformis]